MKVYGLNRESDRSSHESESETESDYSSTSSLNKNQNQATDFLSLLSYGCQEKIFNYIGVKQLLQLCLVSKAWKQIVESSPTVMRKIEFNYNHQSKQVLMKSSKKLQNIKVKQEFVHYDSGFLTLMLQFYLTLKSISFVGTYEKKSIQSFFESLRSHLNSGKMFKISHLTFVGSSGTKKMEMKGSKMLLENLCNYYKRFETITLSGFASATFSNLFPYLKCKKLVLNNMNLMNLENFMENLKYNVSVEKLQLFMTAVDEKSLEIIVERFCKLKAISMTSQMRRSLNAMMNFFIEDLVNEELLYQKTADLLVNIPEELHFLILQHLDYEEWKEVSLVSRTWFNATNILISAGSMYNLETACRRRREYRTVFMTLDRDLSKKLTLIQPFIPNLRDLYIEIVSLQSAKIFFSICRFDNLTWLRLVSNDRDALDDLDFSNCPSLQELHLDVFKVHSDEPKDTKFVKYLSKAQNLKVLSFVDCKNLDNFFVKKSFSAMPFKLTQLQMPIIKRFGLGSNNFNEFLKSQSETLEELYLHQVDQRTISTVVESFKLKSLGFLEVKGQPNSKIRTCESLKLLQLRFTSLDLLLPYLSLAPNMDTLHIPLLNDEIFRHVIENFPKIKEIKYGENRLTKKYAGDISLYMDNLVFEEYDELKNQKCNESDSN